MKKYIITLIITLCCLVTLLGQDNAECSLLSTDIWTDRDYLFAGDALSGTLFIQGKQQSSVTAELNLVQAETNRIIQSKYIRLDLQKGSFELQIPSRTKEGWYWLFAQHPANKQILAAKKLFVITSGEEHSIPNKDLLTVFPEGGSWVTGESQRFLIIAQPEIEKVLVYSNQNPIDTLLLRQGIVAGKLTLDDSAAVSFRYSNGQETVSVPVSATNTPTLLVKENNGNIEVKVSGLIEKEYQVVIKSKTDSISYDTNNQPIVLPKRFLPKGLKHIGLYENGNLIGSSWYYIQPNSTFNVEVFDKNEAVISDSILLEVAVKDQLGRPVPSALIEHAYYPYFQSSDNGLQQDFTMLASHNRRIAISKAENEEEINELLIGAEFIRNDLYSAIDECLPEGIIVKGGLTETAENGQSLLLAIPGTLPGLYNTNTFGSDFSFPPVLENDRSSAYITGTPPVNNELIKINKTKTLNAVNLYGTERPNREIIDHQLQIALIEKNFKGSVLSDNPDVVNEIPKTYYRKADYRISIDDFVYLEQMSVVIKEIIPYVFFKRKKIMIFSEEQRKTFAGRPLLMIDGIPVSSDSSILKLEPAEIDHIDVLNKRNSLLPLGYLAQNGVMAIYTKTGDYVPDEAVQIELPAFVSKARNQLYLQKTKEVGSLDLTDVTKWWSGDFTKGQPSIKRYPTLDLGDQYEILLGAFHPELGMQFQRKEISIKYSNVK